MIVNNSALTAFVPNLHSRISRIWKRNWVDGKTGVARAKQGFSPLSQCFAGIPVETLSGCALKCLEEGAPNAKTMKNEDETKSKCNSFAYNRHTRLCVRLPAFARQVEFTPYQNTLNSDGWQNF